MCLFWNVPFSECALFGKCPFWNVPFLECALFGMCCFWNSKKDTFQKGHIPKIAHSKKDTFQKEHIPKTVHFLFQIWDFTLFLPSFYPATVLGWLTNSVTPIYNAESKICKKYRKNWKWYVSFLKVGSPGRIWQFYRFLQFWGLLFFQSMKAGADWLGNWTLLTILQLKLT